MAKMTLWGFDGSTYVRTVKMLLAEKKFTDFEQVPLNVLSGEPRIRSIWLAILSERCPSWITTACASWRPRRSSDT